MKTTVIRYGLLVVAAALGILLPGRLLAEKLVLDTPDWLAATKLSGDFRLRQQWDDVTDKDTRSRQRIRLRLNATTQINDRLEVGFGLATGGDDPRSSNETLDNNFETPDIRLNYAYAEFRPMKGLAIWGGKYKGIKYAFWRPTDLLWDSDITPEGVGVEFKSDLLFAYGGWLVIDENSAGSDPGMGYIQAGLKVPLGENAHLKAAGTAYLPGSLQGAVMEHSSGSNTTNEESGLAYDFTVYQGTVELGGRDIIGLDKAALVGDYAVNTDPDNDNIAWDCGITLSKSRFSLKYVYRYLERDAFLDVTPDSDAFGGQTGVEGHELELAYKITEKVSASVDLYAMTEIDGDIDRNIAQLDLTIKF